MSEIYKVDAKQLKNLVKVHYEKTTPLMVYGGFGLGKSSIVLQQAQALAKEKGKEFIDWNRTPSAKRNEMFENPEKYFVFTDVRLSQNDSTDLRGLPKFDGEGDSVEWKLPKWVSFFSEAKSDGIIFFDEINLAPPSILASAYQILHDRCNGETALSGNIGLVGAGNRAQDRAHTFDMPMPLRDRMSEVELQMNIDNWFEWAILEGQVDPRIVSYLKFKQTDLSKLDKENKAKPITPRGWERVSKLIKGLPDRGLLDIVSAGIGEAIAIQFTAFLKLRESVDLVDLLNNPKKMQKIVKLDLKYAIIGGVAEKYNSDKKIFDKCIDLCEYVDADFGVLLLQLMKGHNTSHFKASILKSKKGNDLIERYFKYFY